MSEKIEKEKDIQFHVRKYNPEKDSQPHMEQFTVRVHPGMTILDGLHQIKQNFDFTLAWRYSCRMGVCGSCGMLINGRPTLACNTQILHVSETAITVAPLPNFKIIRDLVPELEPLFEKHASIIPQIVREDELEQESPEGEYYQTPEQLVEYLQFTYCIKCGCCMAACPTLATDSDYIGPQPLAQAYRYSIDSRDSGFEKRKARITGEHGIFSCHYGGECSSVCPKGADPARAIQLMKRSLLFDFLKLRPCRKPAEVLGTPSGVQRREEIPHAPVYTVEQK